MSKRYVAALGTAGAMALAIAGATSAQAAGADLNCRMKFSLKGWSAIYKHASGQGTVTCANGKSMKVDIEARGGGLTAGKWRIDNGNAKFTDVHAINDVLGSYAEGGANIGLVKSGNAQILTKGTVSMALAGAGEGVNIGISFGGLTIKKAR